MIEMRVEQLKKQVHSRQIALLMYHQYGMRIVFILQNKFIAKIKTATILFTIHKLELHLNLENLERKQSKESRSVSSDIPMTLTSKLTKPKSSMILHRTSRTTRKIKILKML